MDAETDSPTDLMSAGIDENGKLHLVPDSAMRRMFWQLGMLLVLGNVFLSLPVYFGTLEPKLLWRSMSVLVAAAMTIGVVSTAYPAVWLKANALKMRGAIRIGLDTIERLVVLEDESGQRYGLVIFINWGHGHMGLFGITNPEEIAQTIAAHGDRAIAIEHTTRGRWSSVMAHSQLKFLLLGVGFGLLIGVTTGKLFTMIAENAM